MSKSHATGRKEDTRPTSGQKAELREQIHRGQVSRAMLQEFLLWHRDPLMKLEKATPATLQRTAMDLADLATEYGQPLFEAKAELLAKEIAICLSRETFTLQPHLEDLFELCVLTFGWHRGNVNSICVVTPGMLNDRETGVRQSARQFIRQAAHSTVLDALDVMLANHQGTRIKNLFDPLCSFIARKIDEISLDAFYFGHDWQMNITTWPAAIGAPWVTTGNALTMACIFALQDKHHLRRMMRHLVALYYEGNVPLGFTPDNDLVVLCADTK